MAGTLEGQGFWASGSDWIVTSPPPYSGRRSEGVGSGVAGVGQNVMSRKGASTRKRGGRSGSDSGHEAVLWMEEKGRGSGFRVHSCSLCRYVHGSTSTLQVHLPGGTLYSIAEHENAVAKQNGGITSVADRPGGARNGPKILQGVP